MKTRSTGLRRSVVVAAAASLSALLSVGALTPARGEASGLHPKASSQAASAEGVDRYRAGRAQVRDTKGRVWQPDAPFAVGGRLRTTRHPSGKAKKIFRSQRIAARGWSVPVAGAGDYSVTYTVVTCPRRQRCRTVTRARTVTASERRLSIPNPFRAPRAGVAAFTVAAQGPDATAIEAARSVGFPSEGVFRTGGVWRTDVRDAPVAAGTEAMIAGLAQDVKERYNGVAAFNVYQYGMSWYTVKADVPRTTMRFSNCQNKPKTPAGLFGPGGHFESVPVPSSALTSPGTDSTLSLYQPSTDTLWDFWKAYKDEDGWHACWGGRIDNVSSSQGLFPRGFGASATSLAFEGGVVTIEDVQSGVVDHALGIAIPEPAHWTNFSWPAQRSDGNSVDPDAIPEGTWLRLNPDLDVESLGLTKIGTMVAKAAQTYGLIVTDRAGTVAVRGENPFPTQQVSGADPWAPHMEGLRPSQIFSKFPWDQLQVLPRDYGKPSSWSTGGDGATVRRPTLRRLHRRR